jgi:hypothetical protein
MKVNQRRGDVEVGSIGKVLRACRLIALPRLVFRLVMLRKCKAKPAKRRARRRRKTSLSKVHYTQQKSNSPTR